MRDLSDELLMAYVDGELDDAARVSVEAALATNFDAQRRLEVFRTTSTNLRDLFDAAFTEPVPQRLIDTIRNSALGEGTDRDSAANVVPFKAHARFKSAEWTLPSQLLAASLAVAALASGAYLAFRNGPHYPTGLDALMVASDGKLTAGADLAIALNTVTSGSVKSIVTGGTKTAFTAVFTFKTSDGQYCRQYELENQTANAARVGVVCRSVDGAWVVKGDAPVAMRKSEPSGAIVPAGKEPSTVIDTLVDNLISGDVLGPAGEAAAIKDGWRETK